MAAPSHFGLIDPSDPKSSNGCNKDGIIYRVAIVCCTYRKGPTLCERIYIYVYRDQCTEMRRKDLCIIQRMKIREKVMCVLDACIIYGMRG